MVLTLWWMILLFLIFFGPLKEQELEKKEGINVFVEEGFSNIITRQCYRLKVVLVELHH